MSNSKVIYFNFLANGRCLVCNFTYTDSLAASHLNRAVLSSDAVANDAESLKSSKYLFLSVLYVFVMPIAVETLSALGDDALAFFRELRQCITATAAEPRSFQFLMQLVSVVVQRARLVRFLRLT